ncbi:MAG: hypothetical protein HYX86_00555 [Chloroflexi bacterium]|nr:hypothetical protein [Chloroflexota bacterium]
MKKGLASVFLLAWILITGPSTAIRSSTNLRVIATPAPLTGEGARATLRLVPAPASCCGPEVTRVVLAYYKTPGIAKFRINTEGIITLIYDPDMISLPEIIEITARASGLRASPQDPEFDAQALQ